MCIVKYRNGRVAKAPDDYAKSLEEKGIAKIVERRVEKQEKRAVKPVEPEREEE